MRKWRAMSLSSLISFAFHFLFGWFSCKFFFFQFNFLPWIFSYKKKLRPTVFQITFHHFFHLCLSLFIRTINGANKSVNLFRWVGQITRAHSIHSFQFVWTRNRGASIFIEICFSFPFTLLLYVHLSIYLSQFANWSQQNTNSFAVY